MGKPAAKAGSAVAAPRTAAAPGASVNSTRHAVDNENIASLRPATAGRVKGRESGGGESADATTRGSPHTSSREERARSRCASSNDTGARRSHFSADLPAALAEATLEIESPMVPPLVQGTSSEPGPGSLSEAGTSWAGLIGATSTAQPRVQLLAAQEADSPAEALRLAGRVDAEQTFGALSFPSRPLPSLSVPQQAHTTDFWHPRKNKARVASSAEGPAALAPARTACPGLPLAQPAVRPLRRTSAQEHWQRGAMAAAPAERAPSLATPRVQSPRRQVEYYFSASNLQKDFFLRRHIEADAHGFVALELLNSFPQSSLVKPAPPYPQPVAEVARLCLSLQITAPRSSPPQAFFQGERPSPAGAASVPRKVSASIGFCCRAPLLFFYPGACGPSASPRNNSRRAWPPRRSWKSTPPLVAYAGARCQALPQPAPSAPAPRLSRTMLSTLLRQRDCHRRTGATLPD